MGLEGRRWWWAIAVRLWPSRYHISDNGYDEGLVVKDLEEWLWERLPYRLYMFVANVHDMLPWAKGEWTADEDGYVR